MERPTSRWEVGRVRLRALPSRDWRASRRSGRRSVTVLPRECYEASYFGHHGRRRVLLAGQNGDQHRYRIRIGQRKTIDFFRNLDVRPGLTTLHSADRGRAGSA